MKRVSTLLALAAAVALPAGAEAQAFNGGLIGTCSGVVGTSCGTSNVTTDDVGLSGLAGSTRYGWVSTNGGTNGVGQLAGVGGTNGALLSYSFSTINPNTTLSFKFNYITSDGAGFSDYGWAQLIGGATPINLFNARTAASGNTVPGFGLPGIQATISPASTPIIPGAPNWAPLGTAFNNRCFDTGCGSTGWFTASYTIATAGNYTLNFGVTNWSDRIWESGLAFDFALGQGGTPIVDPNPVPEPMTVSLLVAGLAGLGVAARRRRNA
jgi:hypothetical protein